MQCPLSIMATPLMHYISPIARKPVFKVCNQDSNQPAQLLRLARLFKFSNQAIQGKICPDRQEKVWLGELTIST